MEQKDEPSYLSSHKAPLYFLAFSAMGQAAGLAMAMMIYTISYSAWLSLLALAFTAFGLARWLRLSLPWQIFNLLLAPGAIVWSMFQLPSGLTGAVLLLALLLFLPTFWTRVPYYPTNPKLYGLIAERLPSGRPFRFIDLGCGGGRLLSYLASRRPEGRYEGVDISPLAVLASTIVNLRHSRQRVKISFKSFWQIPLGDYDVVYAFLAPGPMPELWAKVKREMKKGSLFITNTFEVSGKAAEVIHLEGTRQNALYIHRM